MEGISLERRFFRKWREDTKLLFPYFQTFTPGCGDENRIRLKSQTKISNEKADCDVVVVLHFGRSTD